MRATKGFIKYFAKNPPKFLADDTFKFRVNSKLYDYSDVGSLQKLFNSDIVIEFDLLDWHKLEPDQKLEYMSNFLEGSFRQDRAARLHKKEKLAKKLEDSVIDLPDVDYILDNLQPCRIVGDLRREGGYCFLDRKTEKITDYDYHSIYLSLCRELEEKEVKHFMQNIAHVKLQYNPHGGYGIQKLEDSNNVYSINNYTPPLWHKFKDSAEPKLDEHLEGLFIHLFPDHDCREFVYTWIFHSLTSRCQTYLYLCGGQGSGKNTLANFLMELHGQHNSSSPKNGAISGRFNQFLKDKRFVFLDEFTCRRREDKEVLKSIINNRAQIEGKNRDHDEIDIHASYLIANNTKDAIGLEPVDRRFSVPEINDEPIIKAKGREWVRDLQVKLKDQEVLASFNNWILKEFEAPKYFSDDVWQKENFESIVLSTARIAYVDLVDRILNKEEPSYDYYEEAERFKRIHRNGRYPVMADWQHYLKGLKKSGLPLGEVKTRTFIPRKDLQPNDTSRGDLV